jgi:hypothetical protein
MEQKNRRSASFPQITTRLQQKRIAGVMHRLRSGFGSAGTHRRARCPASTLGLLARRECSVSKALDDFVLVLAGSGLVQFVEQEDQGVLGSVLLVPGR